MAEITYYVLDVETTGLTKKLHEITEFSLIRCKDKVNLFKQVKCDHPETASLQALEITKKSMADLYNGVSKKEACESIAKFLAEDGGNDMSRCIIGHNVSFDRKFLQAMFDECGMDLEVSLWLDTMKMTRQFIKKAGLRVGLKQHPAALKDACELFKTKQTSGQHNAKSDSRNTFYLWEKLKTEMMYIKFIETHKVTKGQETYDFDQSDIEID